MNRLRAENGHLINADHVQEIRKVVPVYAPLGTVPELSESMPDRVKWQRLSRQYSGFRKAHPTPTSLTEGDTQARVFIQANGFTDEAVKPDSAGCLIESKLNINSIASQWSRFVKTIPGELHLINTQLVSQRFFDYLNSKKGHYWLREGHASQPSSRAEPTSETLPVIDL